MNDKTKPSECSAQHGGPEPMSKPRDRDRILDGALQASCQVLIAEGACGALIEAMRLATGEGTRSSAAATMYSLASNKEGCAALIAEGACGALVEALKLAKKEDTLRRQCTSSHRMMRDAQL